MALGKKTFFLSAVVMNFTAMPIPLLAQTSPVIAHEARTPEQPLPMVVLLNQNELLVGRDPGSSYQVGGGLIGAIVDGAIQSTLSNGANEAINPSRSLFSREHAERALISAIRESVAPISWLKLADGPALQDGQAKDAALIQSPAGKLLAADCSYNISQRYQAVYAYCSLQMAANRDAVAPDKRWDNRNLVFKSYVQAQVELANIEKSVGGRRNQWTANSGALLQQGLEHALRKVGLLVGRRLQMTATDFEAAEKNEKFRLVTAYVGMAGEHKGRLLEGQENILQKFNPNAGGSSFLYKPGKDGVVFIEDRDGLYYHWTISAPRT